MATNFRAAGLKANIMDPAPVTPDPNPLARAGTPQATSPTAYNKPLVTPPITPDTTVKPPAAPTDPLLAKPAAPAAAAPDPNANPVQRFIGTDFRSLGLPPQGTGPSSMVPVSAPRAGTPANRMLTTGEIVSWGDPRYFQVGAKDVSSGTAENPEAATQANPLFRAPGTAPPVVVTSRRGPPVDAAPPPALAPAPVVPPPAPAPAPSAGPATNPNALVVPPPTTPNAVSRPATSATPAAAAVGTPVLKAAGFESPVTGGPNVVANPVIQGPTAPPPPPPADTTVAQLDASQDTTKYGLPDGRTVGYGGKLNDDVSRVYKDETGRAADAQGLDYWRTQLARGMGLDSLRGTMNGSEEGQNWNLQTDPLDDTGFIRRTYKAILGREPDADGIAWLGGVLSQGGDRNTVLDGIKNSAEFAQSGKKWDQDLADKIIGQGNSFKEPDLKGADLEKYNALKQQIATTFKTEMGRDATSYELAKYADMVRTGKLNIDPSTTTTNLTNDQVIDSFYRSLFGENYRPTEEDRAGLGNMLANTPWMKQDDIIRQYAGMRRLGEDYRNAGRNASDTDILNGLNALRTQTTSSPLLAMLRARKTAGFADGGRVKPKKPRAAARGMKRPPITIDMPHAHHLPPEDGGMPLASGGRVHMDGGGRISVDPKTGHIMLDRKVLDRNDPRMWGNSGQYLLRGSQAGSDPILNDDPRYFQRTGSVNQGGGDAGDSMVDTYGLRPDIAQRLNGRVQLGQSGVGGYSEVIDPSKLEYDNEFGIVTDPSNIKGLDPGADRNAALWYAAIMAPAAYGVAANIAGAGAAGGAGGGGTYIPAGEGDVGAVNAGLNSGGSALTPGGAAAPSGGGVPDIFTDTGYVGAGEGDAAAVNAGLTPGGGSGLPPGFEITADGTLEIGAGAEGSVTPSSWQQMTAWMRANPGSVARLGMGLASLVGGSRAAPSSSSSVARTPYTPGAGGTYAPGGPATGLPPFPGGTASPGDAQTTINAARAAAGVSSAAPAAAAAPPVTVPVSGGGSSFSGGGYGTSSVGGGSNAALGAKATDVNDPINTLLGVGNEQLQRYRNFAPLERQVITEAGRAGGAADQQEAAGLAAATVADQFGARRRAAARRPGVDPARAAAMGLPLDVAEGGTSALAQNEARRGAVNGGFGKRMAAIGLGDNALKSGIGAVQSGVQDLIGEDQLATSRSNTAQQVGATMASLSANMTNAERQRELERQRLAQQESQFGRTYGEGQREFDTRLGEDTRRWDTNFGRRNFETDRSYDRSVLTGDRSFDYNAWRDQQGFSRQDDTTAYNRNRNRYTDIGSGFRTAADIYDKVPWSSIFAADGGRVKGGVRTRGLTKFGNGGRTDGPGDGTVDTIPAMLADGEVVLNQPAAELLDRHAPGLLDKVNAYGKRVNDIRRSRAASRGLPERG